MSSPMPGQGCALPDLRFPQAFGGLQHGAQPMLPASDAFARHTSHAPGSSEAADLALLARILEEGD